MKWNDNIKDLRATISTLINIVATVQENLEYTDERFAMVYKILLDNTDKIPFEVREELDEYFDTVREKMLDEKTN